MLTIPNLQRDILLAPYTTYKIGGAADFFVKVTSADELALAVLEAHQAHLPYFILGTGANILIQDGGFRGLVIYNQARSIKFNGTNVFAESGATMAELIEATAQSGLSGLEHFAGIPSSVGGAMRQNLHFLSPDRQDTLFIEEVVESAEVLDEHLKRRMVNKDYFAFGYDDSIIHHKPIVVLSVVFQLRPEKEEEIRQQAQTNLAWRAEKQPPVDQFPSCGSVFKKIDGVGAGRLIDQAGLKGRQIGGAQISEKHANFIINTGQASSADVLALVKLAQETVFEQTGYRLEMEIGVVGEAA